MPLIPPTDDRNRPTLAALLPKPTMSVIECQWRPGPPSPNVDNVNPAMSDFQTAQWVKQAVRGQVLSLIGMPPAVGPLQPELGFEQLRSQRGRFPITPLAGEVDTAVAPFGNAAA